MASRNPTPYDNPKRIVDRVTFPMLRIAYLQGVEDERAGFTVNKLPPKWWYTFETRYRDPRSGRWYSGGGGGHQSLAVVLQVADQMFGHLEIEYLYIVTPDGRKVDYQPKNTRS